MKWVIGGCAALALGTYIFVYTAVRALLDEDWQPDWDQQ